MSTKIKHICLFSLFLIGLVLTSYPFLLTFFFHQQAESTISELRESLDSAAEETPIDTPDSESENDSAVIPFQSLFQAMQEYNTAIYEAGQASLDSVDSYEAPAIELADYGFSFETVGYISIPAMDVELPLYLGASEAHMSRGAVVLGETSLPIGGENTNCVIAAHRGYRGIPYFREIEQLEVGDAVKITNFWETLEYQVVDWQVVPPDSVDQVLIQEGHDMVTLMTCHPYRVGTQRYLVYCERVTGSDAPETVTAGTGTSSPDESVSGDLGDSEASPFESSRGEILLESVLQYAGVVLVLVAGIGFGAICFVGHGKQRRCGL